MYALPCNDGMDAVNRVLSGIIQVSDETSNENSLSTRNFMNGQEIDLYFMELVTTIG